MMRYISVMVLLLCSIVASARGGVEVKVEIASLTNGTITSRMSGRTCTLTVTPDAGYYIRKSDITVQKTVSPSAAVRRGAEIPVTDNLTLKGDEPAAYSAECQYTFDIPEGYNALVTATFTECTAITPAVTLQGWTYGDAANEAEVTGNTGKATVSYSYAVKGTTSFAAAIPTDAGNYTVKVAIPAIGIYTAGEATDDFKITAAPVTITTGSATKTYDGTALTTPDAKADGLVNNETVALTTTGSQTEVGESTNTYTIDWGQTKKANYAVTEQLGKLTVTAATMTVTADGYEGVYDGKAHGITLKNVPEGSTVTYATSQNGTYSETAPTFIDVCDATSVYYKVINSNYNDASGSATAKITAAPVTITTGSASKTYDGTALTTPEANISGLVNNETATVTATGSQTEVGESVNTYTIDWGQTKKANYTVTEQLGKLTVTKKALTITAKNATKVYGTDDPALEYEVDGLVEGDKLEGALVRAEGVNVGTYDILQGTLKASANYAVTFNKGTFTITAAELTGITIDNVTAVYDGKAHSLDVPTNEGVTFKFGTSEGSYEATTAPTLTDVGTLDIFYKAEKANFSPVTGKATVTVTPKAVTVSGIEASISTENGVSTVIVDCSEASIVGVVGGQALTISGVTGTIKETATDGTVTVALDYSKAKLGGDHAKNYVLAAIGHQPTVTVTNKKETSVDIAEDGTKTETKTESTTAISEDGSVTVTESTSQTVTDGQGKVTVTEANTVTETKTDGSTEMTSTVVEKDGNNNVTGKIETTKTDDAKGTTTERTVVKDSDGKVTETREIGSSSRTNTDGSSNETTTVTVKDGNDNVVNTKNVTVEKGADGSVKTTESTYQSNTDGTTQETFEETLKGSDGQEISSQKTELTNNAEGFPQSISLITKSSEEGETKKEETFDNQNSLPSEDSNWTDEEEQKFQDALAKSGFIAKGYALISSEWMESIAYLREHESSKPISNVDLAISNVDMKDFKVAKKSTKIEKDGKFVINEEKDVLVVKAALESAIEGAMENGSEVKKLAMDGSKKMDGKKYFKIDFLTLTVNKHSKKDVDKKQSGVRAKNTSLKKVSVSKAPQNRAPGDEDDDEMIEIESGVEYEILDEGALVLDIDTSDGAVIIESIEVTEEEDSQTGIRTMSDVRGKKSDVWYTLDGRELDKAPVAKGLYFHGGRKIVVR